MDPLPFAMTPFAGVMASRLSYVNWLSHAFAPSGLSAIVWYSH
jgi:hypothetical protein